MCYRNIIETRENHSHSPLLFKCSLPYCCMVNATITTVFVLNTSITNIILVCQIINTSCNCSKFGNLQNSRNKTKPKTFYVFTVKKQIKIKRCLRLTNKWSICE